MRFPFCSSGAVLCLALAGYPSLCAEPDGLPAFPPAALPEPGVVFVQQPAPPRPSPAPAATPPRLTPAPVAPPPPTVPPTQTAVATPSTEDLTSAPTQAGASPPEL